MEFADACLLIFAKAPIEHQVKTRLIPAIGSQNAKQLYQLMVQQMVSLAVRSQICPVQLWCAPNSEHEFFQQLKTQYDLQLFSQQGHNLGERMYHAANHALQTFRYVIIVGCDCLQLTSSRLKSAITSLIDGQHDVEISPALDGGYVLIGLRKVDPRLFQNITWGSDRVLEQTRNALKKLHWSWLETESLRDLDTPDDLSDVISHQNQYQLNPELQQFIQKALN